MGIERHTMNTTEQQEALLLSKWYEEEGGFAQGTKAPHKWVLRAESELRRQHANIRALKAQGVQMQQDMAALRAHIADLDEDLGRTLKDCDTAEEWADRLSELIGKHFGRDIGEHSSAHCPWQAAKEIIEDAEPHIATHRPAAHECREALAACINLLKKTPKITRDIYVGKDRQAWGVQAKAVLDAALVALNQEGGK